MHENVFKLMHAAFHDFHLTNIARYIAGCRKQQQRRDCVAKSRDKLAA